MLKHETNSEMTKLEPAVRNQVSISSPGGGPGTLGYYLVTDIYWHAIQASNVLGLSGSFDMIVSSLNKYVCD